MFDPEAIDKIASYSKGVPRLINTICDNALLIAYAISKFKVSADMIDEAADDLRIEKSRVEQDICTRTHIRSVAEKDLLEPAPIKADERTTKDNPFIRDSDDRPVRYAATNRYPYQSRYTYWLEALHQYVSGIVLLTGLGAFLYSLNGSFPFSGSYGDIAAASTMDRKNTR